LRSDSDRQTEVVTLDCLAKKEDLAASWIH
jgi:hypothetical protein